MNTFIDLSSASSSSSSRPSTSTAPQRATLAHLQNRNHPSTSSTATTTATTFPKMTSASSIFYPPFPRHDQYPPGSHFVDDDDDDDDDDDNNNDNEEQVSMILPLLATEPIPRAQFLQEFDYVDMRSHVTRVELAKKPYFNEDGVLFRSPAESGISYDTFFQTTHDFLDLNMTLHMYPLFVELPFYLRPSKARYDATKQSEDQMLRVRCLFCRGRFGGKNAKAIWERHVKEHWPKQDRNKGFIKEETRRPIRQIQKRPTGSNAHSRTRSHDSSAWAPTSRYNASTSSPSPPSSRASSEEFMEVPSVTIPSPRFYPPAYPAPSAVPDIQYIHSSQSSSSSSDEASDEHDSDGEPTIHVPRTIPVPRYSPEPTIQIPFIRSPFHSPRKRVNRANMLQRSPGYPDDFDTFTFQSCWDIDANLEMIEQTSKPCLSKDQLQAALDAATSRSDADESPRKTARGYRASLFPNAAIPGVDIPTRKRVREEDVDFVHDVAWMADFYSFVQQQDRKRRRTESGSSAGGPLSDWSSSGEDNDSILENALEVASPEDNASSLTPSVDWVETE